MKLPNTRMLILLVGLVVAGLIGAHSAIGRDCVLRNQDFVGKPR